ncbi:DUF4139 domain-containing protein [Streptacidiphilus sp. PB12-B1b]|uniref:DUF4139 domain-containing protein n=1 Tax=Streptacidiphilus sp. PB12-B1b TaxID=2705012 RepID=UPI0015FA9B53|nr:DUF4139 domain-containing protein [Streptacidiphilus sp. PB12-B1b]QMU79171.1 DUF4139 domain-containing protein [Streptacidiphilus sp. PB12-B1b]
MAEDVQLASVLDSVTVYSAGALCRRTAHLDRPPGDRPGGPFRVVLTGLPLALDEQSLRARVLHGPPGLRVLDVRRAIEVALPAPEDLTPLRHVCDQAEEALDAARAARAAVAAQIEHIAALRAVPPPPRRGDPPRRAPVQALLALADFVDARLAGLDQRLFAAEDALREAEQQAQTARRRLGEASAALPTEQVSSTTGVVLTLQPGPTGSGAEQPTSTGPGPGPGAGPGEPVPGAGPWAGLELEYAVPGATWTPAYHLQLTGVDGDAPGGTLAMRACVAQRTGEDWTGVRLGLSTADLRRRTDLPVLSSLRLGRRQAVQSPSPWREPPEGPGALFAGYDAFVRASAPPPPPQSAPPADEEFLLGGSPVTVASADVPLRSARPSGSAPVVHRAAMERKRSAPAIAFGAASPPAGSAPAPSARPAVPPTPPGPGAAERDLGRLTLAGAGEPGPERGRLRPAESGATAAATASRHRAESVTGLDLPPRCLPVRYSAGSFDYRYDTAARVDVPADGAWHTVPVREFPVGLAIEHVCTPFAAGTDAEAAQQVFAALTLRNTSANALLAGAAEVTVDGEYLRSVSLPTLAPGEQRQVGLGVAEGIRMARRVLMRESTAGLRGGTTVLDHAIEIELANRLGRPVTVEVRERVPVSDDKDVRIEDKPASPAWTAVPPEQDDRHQRGLRLWRVTLAPHSTTVLTGGFEIRIPAAKALADGNRRF